MGKDVTFSINLKLNGQDAVKQVSVDIDEVRRAIDMATGSAKKLCENLILFNQGAEFAKNLSGSFKDLVGILNDVTAESRGFSQSMAAVNTMAGKGGEEFSQLKDDVSELAKTIPVARDELANGLYQVISNGVPEDNWISFLEQSAKSSVGGIADLGETVTVTSTVIKNYGLAWSAAGDIQDKIQLTAKNGVTSFEQLAQALPRVTGNAATLGVSVDELLASFATLTGVSGNTAEVSTQLAAIFTALVKPSSDAATMAEEMGIKFDAAAIQAAGGMQNFLTQLSTDIRSYAQANGVLEQEIYGKLFGSAEAMRALIPLTGELADTFEKNVDAMSGSAGTMDQAFETMADTGSANLQILNNKLGELTDIVQSSIGNALPYLNISSQMLMSLSAIAQLTVSMKSLGVTITTVKIASVALGKAKTAVAATSRMLTTVLRGEATGATVAAIANRALSLALKGLMAATGIGLIIMGISTAIEYLTSSAKDASEEIDVLQESTDAYNQTAASTKADVDMAINALKDLMNGQGDEKKMVDELNQKYGEALGHHKSAAEWYKILIDNSRAYCDQLAYEAQAKVLASQLAQKQMELEEKMQRRMQLNQLNMYADGSTGYEKDRNGRNRKEWEAVNEAITQLQSDISQIEGRYNGALSKMADAASKLRKEEDKSAASVSWKTASYEDLGKMIEKQKQKVSSLAGVNDSAAKKESATLKQMESRYKRLGETYGLVTSSKTNSAANTKKETLVLIENAQTYDELGNNIKYYQEKLEKTSKTETATISLYKEKIQLLKRQQEEIDSVGKSYAEQLKAQLDYARKEFEDAVTVDAKVSAQAKIDDIQRKIDRETKGELTIEATVEPTYITNGSTDDMRRSYENAHNIANRIQTDLEIGIIGKEEAEKQINDLNKKIVGLGLKPIELEIETNTQKLQKELDDARKEFENAVTVDAKVRAQAKIDEIQREIDRETKGELTIEATVEPAYITKGSIDDVRRSYENAQSRANRIQTDLEIGLIGKKEAEEQIADLNRQLKGMGKNLKPLKIEVDTKKFDRAMKSMKKGWNSIKGISDGVNGITEALKGNGSAWEKTCAIIDGMFTIYEGITGVIELINLLTSASIFHKGAKAAESVATGIATGATILDASQAPAAAAAKIPLIAANKAATNSYLELASAAYFAAHAYIPFAGFGIAAGYAMSAAIMTKAIGAIPFADGGLIYGPTLGLIGEYAGARSNPEVVAPLDKLRSIIQPEGNGLQGKVDFKIRGRRLEGVLEKERRHRMRT